MDPKLEQLIDWAYPYIIKEYERRGWPTPKKNADTITSNLNLLPDDSNKYRLYTSYKLSRGLYWQATDFFNMIPKEERESYAKEMIKQAKVGGTHDWNSDYLWIVTKHHDGTLTEFIDDNLLDESVNNGFWEFVGRELTQKVMGALKDYQVLISYKDRIKIDKVPIEKDIRATFLCSWDNRGSIISGLWWPDDNFVEIFNKFKNNLSKDDAAKLVRPIIDIEIKAALDDEFEGNRTKALEEGFKPYNEYLNHPRIQSLFEEYIRGYASAMDLRFEYLLSYWNQSEENVKKFISNLLKDEYSLNFIYNGFPIKYLTDDLKSKIRTESEEYLKNPQSWDKSIVPNIYKWADAVYYDYIPKEDAEDFIEQKVKRYMSKKRISKKRLMELYNQLPDFVSPELKEEIRKRVGIK